MSFGITAFAQSPFAALGGNVYSASITESIAVDDSITSVVLKLSFVDESVAVGSTVTAIVTFNPAVTETAAVEDSISAAGSTYNVAVAESAVIDAFQSFTGNELAVSITEHVVAADNLSVQFIGYVDVAESAAVSDTQTGARAFNKSVSESAAIAETQAAGLDLVDSVNETILVADSITYTYNANVNVTGILLTLSIPNVNVWGDIDNDENPNWVQIKD